MYFVKLCCVLLVLTLVSIASDEDSFSLSEEHGLVRGRLLHTFPVLAKEWKVSFEVNPSTYEDGWRNILHLRYPSGFFHAGVSCLSISIQSSRWCNSDGWQCSTNPIRLSYKFLSNGEAKYFRDYLHIPQLRTWSKIEVKLVFEGDSYKILFNNGTKTKPVLSPEIFEDVKVYASDPWNEAQPGKIRDLCITNLNTGD